MEKTEELKELITDELIAFATEFSENYMDYSVGTYVSDEKTYKLEYLKSLTDNGRKVQTNARILNSAGVFQLDKTKLTLTKGYSSDYIYYLIIWLSIYKVKEAYYQSDKLAMEHCLESRKSAKEILNGNLIGFKPAMSDLNIDRLKAIRNYLPSK